MAEAKHKEQLLGLMHMGADTEVIEEGFYLGHSETRGFIMLCPALRDFVAGELGKEAALLKEDRKYREERQGLVEKVKKPKPKKTGKGLYPDDGKGVKERRRTKVTAPMVPMQPSPAKGRPAKAKTMRVDPLFSPL